jgi:hypothetical protein
MSFLRHPFGCATYNYLLKGSCSRCPQNDQVGIPFPRTIDHLNERASAGYLGGERQTLQRGLRGRDERLHSGVRLFYNRGRHFAQSVNRQPLRDDWLRFDDVKYMERCGVRSRRFYRNAECL